MLFKILQFMMIITKYVGYLSHLRDNSDGSQFEKGTIVSCKTNGFLFGSIPTMT